MFDVIVFVVDGRVTAIVGGGVGTIEGALKEIASRIRNETGDIVAKELFEFDVRDIELLGDNNGDDALTCIGGGEGGGSGNIGKAKETSL